MKMVFWYYAKYHQEFLTVTCLNWTPVLAAEENKNIVIESLRFLVKDGRVKVLCFVSLLRPVPLLVFFTSAAPVAQATLADFDGDANDLSSQFHNVPTPIPYGSANHTIGGSYVIRMNQTTPVGPSLNKAVYPGDKVDMEVYSYYEASSGYGTTNAGVTSLITSVTGALIASTGGADVGGFKSNGVNSGLTNFGIGANQGDAAPAAFLNYILFDLNYKVMDAGWQVVPGTSFSKQYVSLPQITVKEAGYIFVYLSYEDVSNNWIYFDDFKVTVTPTNIIQSNEYYPFGMQTANSWTRDSNTNNFLYNQGSELNNTSGFYDLPFRNYDATLGRFFQIDALATSSHTMTPYHYAGNNPVGYNDPTGLYRQDSEMYGPHGSQAYKGGTYWSDWFRNVEGLNDRPAGDWGPGGSGGGMKMSKAEFWATINSLAASAPYGKNTQIYGQTDNGEYSFMATPGMLYRMLIRQIGNYVAQQYKEHGINVTSLIRPVGLDEMAASLDDSWNLTQGDPDQGNPLKKHIESSITIDQWVAKYQGKSYTDIITEAGWKQGLPLGPNSRYVINPNDGNVMDMRHVMVVGYLTGVDGGNAVEEIQNFLGQKGSAYDPQDYYSNKIGEQFFNYKLSNGLMGNDWAWTFLQYMTKP